MSMKMHLASSNSRKELETMTCSTDPPLPSATRTRRAICFKACHCFFAADRGTKMESSLIYPTLPRHGTAKEPSYLPGMYLELGTRSSQQSQGHPWAPPWALPLAWAPPWALPSLWAPPWALPLLWAPRTWWLKHLADLRTLDAHGWLFQLYGHAYKQVGGHL